MKIVIVAPFLATRGGANRWTWELCEYLASQNDDVVLVSLYTNRQIFDSKKNLKVEDIADKNSLTQSLKFWLNLKNIQKKIRSFIEKENPDVVLFMNFPATLWATKFQNKPILCYPQDINLLYTNTYIKNLTIGKYFLWIIIRLFIRGIDKKKWECFDEVICNSKYSEKHISKNYNVKTSVIHLGTRTNKFKPTRNTKKRAFLSLAAQKAQRSEFLINASKELLKKREDFEIWIVGNHDEHDLELKKLVKKMEMEKNVKFFGRVSDEKLAELYSESLATIHLVKTPPFGMIVTESMACETPVIACKPGGTEETIIHGKTGFLINENNKENLITYLEKFLDNPNLSNEMGKEDRKRVIENFEMSKKNQEMRLFIQNWIKRKNL